MSHFDLVRMQRNNEAMAEHIKSAMENNDAIATEMCETIQQFTIGKKSLADVLEVVIWGADKILDSRDRKTISKTQKVVYEMLKAGE